MPGDTTMRQYSAGLAAPTFDDPAWVHPKPLAECTVAIVTSAALHVSDDSGFVAGDTSFRVIDSNRRDVVMGHWSPNFDRVGFAADINVVFPIDRLNEMATSGAIAAVAPRHISFAGNQPDDVATVRLDSGPRAAALLRDDGVDVAILTPV